MIPPLTTTLDVQHTFEPGVNVPRFCRVCGQREGYRTHAAQPAPPTETLVAEWQQAEAALPKGWALSVIGSFDESGAYLVSAMSRAGRTFTLTGRPTEEGLIAEGSLTDALRSIREQLEARRYLDRAGESGTASIGSIGPSDD